MEIINKALIYLQGEFGLLNGVGFTSIALFANPVIILRLNKLGIVLLIAGFLLSLIQSRFYAIFFTLAFLCADLPKFKEDKKFWVSTMFFALILFLWFYLEAQRVDWWVAIHGL